MTVVIAGFSVSQPLMLPRGIREMHKRLVLQYFVASTEPFQSSVLKPGKTKSGLCPLVSCAHRDIFWLADVVGRKERRFE
jgi:hypothetical protein